MAVFGNISVIGVILLGFMIKRGDSACLANQYLDGSLNQCVTCNSTCSSCVSTADTCTGCVEGYYLSSSACLSCSPACSRCTSSSACSSCYSKYYLSSNNCLPCSLNCMQCIDNATCSTCIVGYNLSSNCLSCSNQFYMNITYNTCDGCGIGCLLCSDKASCKACQSGYQMTKDKTCEYYGTSQYDAKNSQDHKEVESSSDSVVFIVLGSVLGGIFGIVCLACIVYSCVKNKKIIGRKDRENVIANSIGHIDIEKEFGIQIQTRICSICRLKKAEIPLKCGHFVHKLCFLRQKKCFICLEESSVDGTRFNEQSSGSRSEISKEDNHSQLFAIQKGESKHQLEESQCDG